MSIKLDERLSACAEFVREDAILADVGTDHAYLPTALILEGKIKKALACDVNEKPLKSASATVKENKIQDSVALRLCDGLCGIKSDEFSDLVIAGMGGELIINILSACSYIKDKRYNLVLQPMSKAYDLRVWLCQNGFEILDEKVAVQNKKIYTVINAQFNGKKQAEDESFYHFGKLKDKDDEKSKMYVEKIKTSLIKRANGILSADKTNREALKLLEICK